jgi:pimeloyl-ACP methyl ester carboxylesterase
VTMLNRQPWTRSFQRWLSENTFDAQSLRWQRAGGAAEILALGHLNNLERPILLFAHGLGNDALFPNIYFFKYLLSAGYNIFTADIDGHGKTTSSLFSQSTIQSFVPDVIDKIDSMSIGRPQLHCCGYSIGAVLLLNYAVYHPERIRSLSMIGPPLNLATGIQIAKELLSPLRQSYLQSIRDYGPLGIHPAIGPILRGRYPVRLGHNEQASYLHAAAQVIASLDPVSKLPLVTFPTLLVAGSLDALAHHGDFDQFIDLRNIQTFKLKGETHFTSMLCGKLVRRIEVFLRNAP